MKRFLAESVLLVAVSAFAAAQTTPTTTPNNTNNNGAQNPTQQQTTPVPNPNAAPPPDVNTNPGQTGTATQNGSATPDATTKSGDADQNVTPATPQSTTTNDQSTTSSTSSTTQSASNSSATSKDSLTGCLESAGSGQFAIRTKSDKSVNVIASSMFAGNFADHVGERVRVKGQYSASDTAMNTNPSTMPQSDQPPTTSATGKDEMNNPAKDSTLPPSANAGTSANSSNTNPAAAADASAASANGENSAREFRADTISTLSKTCGSNSNPR
jgi:hypothetical protein